MFDFLNELEYMKMEYFSFNDEYSFISSDNVYGYVCVSFGKNV